MSSHTSLSDRSIPLVTLNSSSPRGLDIHELPDSKLAPPFHHKSSDLSTSAGAPPVAASRKVNVKMPSWSKWEKPFWAGVPIFLNVLAIALAMIAILQNNLPYLSVIQVGGTGRMDFQILSSCAIAPGTTERICTPRTLFVDFSPSLNLIAPAVPGYAILQLPFYSAQTQAVFLAGLVSMVASFILYLPIWTIAYFPSFPFPRHFVNFLRYYPSQWYIAVGVLSFIGMILTVTIGVGWLLLLTGHQLQFLYWVENSFFFPQLDAGTTQWTAKLGNDAFALVWASSFCMAVVTLGINVTLKYGVADEIERYGEEKEHYFV